MTSVISSAQPAITVSFKDCTIELCPISAAQLPYDPNLAGNVLYLSIFSVCLVASIVLGLWYRTWGYLVAMFFGGMLEVLGYIGRVQMHFNPFPQDPFLLYLICVTIASVFFTAAIYLCLSRIVVVFGENLSMFRPRTYTILFVICDVISLMLQCGGGTIVSMADNQTLNDIGVHIAVAGLSFQVASLLVFITLCGLFARSCRRRRNELDPRFARLRASGRFRFFLRSLVVATITMLIRCIFRIAELSEGFKGRIWVNEVAYMVLEGAMISICAIALTLGHPGIGFAGEYKMASFKVFGKEAPKRSRTNI